MESGVGDVRMNRVEWCPVGNGGVGWSRYGG